MDDIKLVGPFSQLIPMTGLPIKGPIVDQELSIVENGGIVIENGVIQQIGGVQGIEKRRLFRARSNY